MSTKHDALGAAAAVLLFASSAIAEPAPPAVPGAQAFVDQAAVGGLAEIEMSQLAKSKATRRDVQALARRMVSDHETANAELEKLVAAKKLVWPTELDPRHEAAMKALEGVSGEGFDPAYVDVLVRGHAEMLDLLARAARETGDPDLRAFAQRTAEKVREHRGMIENLRVALSTGRPDAGPQSAGDPARTSVGADSAPTSIQEIHPAPGEEKRAHPAEMNGLAGDVRGGKNRLERAAEVSGERLPKAQPHESPDSPSLRSEPDGDR